MATRKPAMVNDENASPIRNVVRDSKSSSGGVGGKLSGSRKSLIPLPKSSPSSTANDENNSPALAQLTNKLRRPLGQVQHGDSPSSGRRSSESAPSKKLSLGAKAAAVNVSKSSLKDVAMGTKVNTPVNKLRLSTSAGVPRTPQNSPSKTKLKVKKEEVEDKSTAKEKENVEGQGKGEESLAYWKELSESRRVSLEDAMKEVHRLNRENDELREKMYELRYRVEDPEEHFEVSESRRVALEDLQMENYELQQRVEQLEKDKAELEELVEEAKKLAIMVSEAAEELELDESGICDAGADENNK